jgi:hypothetical protein
MLAMLGAAARYIDTHPRLILIGAWPMMSLFLAALIWIIWKGPWPADAAHQQLNILGCIAYGFLGTFALTMLAQSITFFGKLGVRVGSLIDLNADGAHKD